MNQLELLQNLGHTKQAKLLGTAIGEGSGHSKKESEQMAAKSALEKLADK